MLSSLVSLLASPLATGKRSTRTSLERALQEHTACVIFSPDGIVVQASPLFLATMGYRESEVVGQHHRLFCTPNYSASPAYSDFWEALVRGEHRSGTFRRVGKGGGDIWIEASYIPVKNSSARKVTHIVKIANDITAKYRTMMAQVAVSSALDRSMAVIEFTPEGIITRANSNFLAATGYSHEQIEGQHHRMFCREAFYRDNPDFWDRLAAGEYRQGKFERVTASGQELWLEATYNPVFDDEGRVVSIVKFATDVTTDIQAAEATRNAVLAAQETSTQTEQ